MADYGSIGLCSISASQDRKYYASLRYLDDKTGKTLTIRSGLNEDEYDRAVQRVEALRKRYPDFKAVLNSPVPAKQAVGRNASFVLDY